MIPKRAIFYWEGPEPSWLRRQSWETFAKLNPDWQVAIVGPDAQAKSLIPGHSRMAIAQRSDLVRYAELANGGGYYFDTDIAFFSPMPSAWLNADVALVLYDDQTISHIGMMGAAPGSKLFEGFHEKAKQRAIEADPLGYQSLGVTLVGDANIRALCDNAGSRWLPLPQRAVIGVSWQTPEKAWAAPPEGHKWMPGSIGLHWYGGDHLSRELEPTATAESLRGTVIGKALGL